MSPKRSLRADPVGQLEKARLEKVLGYQLAQATIVTDAIFFEQVGEPFKLRPVEYTVLTLIAENPGGSLVRLARALSVTPPHITTTVERLEGKGLIVRRAGEEDRRAHVLHVTRTGAELVRKTTHKIMQAERGALALTAGEYAILTELLHKVAGARVKRREAETLPLGDDTEGANRANQLARKRALRRRQDEQAPERGGRDGAV
jgi:DNA-binding MarR family transcriptional regulator